MHYLSTYFENLAWLFYLTNNRKVKVFSILFLAFAFLALILMLVVWVLGLTGSFSYNKVLFLTGMLGGIVAFWIFAVWIGGRFRKLYLEEERAG